MEYRPTSTIKDSTQSPGESDDTSTVAIADTNSQRYNLRPSTKTSSKRQREPDNMANPQTTLPPSKQRKTAPKPGASYFDITSLPTELRLMTFRYFLNDAAGPKALISTHPRSKNLPDPPAEPWMPPAYGPQQTQWHARRGLLQASSILRAEALQVLCESDGFFARMPLGVDPGFDGKGRFERWLKALGSEEEVGRVRRVVFGIEWPAVRCAGGMKWCRRRTEVEICVFGGKGSVRARLEAVEAMWVQKEETPWLVLEDVKEMIGEILESKEEGGRLECKEWMKVWGKVEEVMRLQCSWDTQDF